MKEFTGITASPGIVIGKVYLHIDNKLRIPKYDIEIEQISTEYERFQAAIIKATNEIKSLISQNNDDMSIEERRLIETHILMLNDPEFNSKIYNRLTAELKNVEWVLMQVIDELVQKLNATKEEYLRERTIDFFDISQRILQHLLYQSHESLADLKEEVIIVAQTLLPSDALSMNKKMVKGIASNTGGRTSHIAILARSFELPTVLGLSNITEHVKTGDEIIIDGTNGRVIVQPDAETKEIYSRSQKKWQDHEIQLLNLNILPAETLDGKMISLKANIEVPEEVKSVLIHGADGIGLYRSEFLFIQPLKFPSEDEQYEAYKSVLEAMNNKPVIIRTFDFGGDKIIPGLRKEPEANPLLGWRAIRFCLNRPEIFTTQLRALFRATMHGNLKIMFPMISSPWELEKIYELVEKVKNDLTHEGIKFVKNIDIGIMIEVPSAAIASDILAKKVDFFSIGTNDLIQYTVAVDRGNERVAYLYQPFHPAVLRLIKLVIENAHKENIPVTMCGEMAGDPYASVLLLGLGLDRFSMTAYRIPEIKKIIRAVTLKDAKNLARKVLAMESAEKIEEYVKGWMDERFDFITA